MGGFFTMHGLKLLGGGMLVSALAAGTFFLLWQSADARADLNEERFKNAQATILNMELDRTIAEKAAAERAADETKADDQRRELNDAANTPGDSPVDSRLRRLCVLKRQQSGSDGLPSECERFSLEG
ncbi:MAG: hypothetical protein AAFY42_02875 [Pseudomonadota bacterium]